MPNTSGLPLEVYNVLHTWIGNAEILHFWETDETYHITVYRANRLFMYRVFRAGGQWRLSQDAIVHLPNQ